MRKSDGCGLYRAALATRPSQVDENVAAAGVRQTPDGLAEIDGHFPAAEHP
ncbi:MAG: hypothetical protein IPM64_03010 [Phycisphaerales bacterium]|nr:hypothetical protein [Phycisphaerales bacterium]